MDQLVAFVFMAFSVVFYYLSSQLPPGAPGQPGPSFFPKAVTLFIFAVALLLLVKSFIVRPADAGGSEFEVSGWKDYFRVFWAIVLSATYLYTMEGLGFILSTFGFCLVCLLILGERRPVVIGLLSTLLALIIFIVFKSFLSVPLPEGILYF